MSIPGLPGWEQLRPWHYEFHAVPDLPEALVAGKERTYLTYFYKRSSYKPEAFPQAEIDEFVKAYTAPGALYAGFEYYRAIPEVERQNQIYARTKLQMPVLYVGGANGVGIATLRQLQTVSDNIRGHVIEQGGHWLPIECPDRLASDLIDFFNEKNE